MTRSNHTLGKYFFPSALIILGIAGAALVYYATVWGVGFIDWDSFNYIAVARSLSEGLGFVYPLEPRSYAPLTNFPPLYATILALFELVNIDAIAAARHLNAFLFGLSVFLIGIAIRRATRSSGFGILASILLLISSTLVFYHSFALAEGLYIFLTILGFLLLIIYIDERKWYQLLLTSAVLGLSILTRYVGIANILTALIILGFYRKKDWLHTFLDMTAVLVISLGPFLMWIMRSYPAEPATIDSLGPAGIQQLGWQFSGKEHFTSMFLTIYHTFFKYFLPGEIVVGAEKQRLLILSAAIISFAVFLIVYGKRNQGDPFYAFKRIFNLHPTLIVYTCYAIIYLTIIMSVSMFGKSVIVARIFLPTLISALVVMVVLLNLLWDWKPMFSRILTGILAAYLVAFSLFRSFNDIPRYHEQGLGLGRKSFHNAQSIKLLQDLPDNTTIYTNYPWALYLHTQEIGYRINAFSPLKTEDGDTWIVLYDYESVKSPEFVKKYAPFLDLLVSDGHVQVYSFRSIDAD